MIDAQTCDNVRVQSATEGTTTCTCTHGRCYAIERSDALAHMVDVA